MHDCTRDLRHPDLRFSNQRDTSPSFHYDRMMSQARAEASGCGFARGAAMHTTLAIAAAEAVDQVKPLLNEIVEEVISALG